MLLNDVCDHCLLVCFIRSLACEDCERTWVMTFLVVIAFPACQVFCSFVHLSSGSRIFIVCFLRQGNADV
jgi:hypothetical protein